MILTIDVEFEIRQVVYLKTDPDQLPRMVLNYLIFDQGEPLYSLGSGPFTSDHHGFEISAEKDPVTIVSS